MTKREGVVGLGKCDRCGQPTVEEAGLCGNCVRSIIEEMTDYVGRIQTLALIGMILSVIGFVVGLVGYFLGFAFAGYLMFSCVVSGLVNFYLS